MASAGLKVIKLINGDEIIGVVRDGADEISGDENYTLDNLLFVTNPMKVVSQYDTVNKVHSLYLVDWIPAIKDNTLPIDKQRVLTLGDPNKSLETHYVDIVLAEHLYNHLADGEDIDPNETLEDIEKKRDLKNKLKKHKFEDDDMQ